MKNVALSDSPSSGIKVSYAFEYDEETGKSMEGVFSG